MEVWPWVSKYAALVLTTNLGIFVSPEIYQSLQKENPNPRDIAVLEHEKKHLKRQNEIGFLKVLFGYLFSRKFRLNEELLAIKEGNESL